MRTILKITSLFVVLVLSACGRRSSDVDLHIKTRDFPKVMPPAMMQEKDEISEWMSFHFWDLFFEDAYDYSCDSVHVAGVGKDNLEQMMANYIYILEQVSPSVARKAMNELSAKVEMSETKDTTCTIFEIFKEIGEKYMYDPNSPLRNEDFFQPLAEMFSRSPHLIQEERDRYAYLSEKCSLNRVGSKAADFRFCNARGREYTLYEIENDYTILFFSNPGCESCMQIINQLSSMPEVKEMVGSGRMAILNIYIDEDLHAWKEYMTIYPKDWYNGFDPDMVLRNNDIYNIRAIPSLYLLDKEKTVLMKDAVPEKLFKYIKGI